MTARRPFVLFVVAGLLGGCGSNVNGADRDTSVVQPAIKESAQSAPVRPVRLPARPAGVFEVSGSTQGSLTPPVAASLDQQDGVRMTVTDEDPASAFRRLCSGTVDAVDSPRPISPMEYATCRRTGVQPVQFQVASDAVVVAIKNETDVGLDCLTLEQVGEIYRAGSGISDWQQLGGFGVPLRTTGPDEDSTTFGYFSRFALGADPPSRSAFRSDYVEKPSDAQARIETVGRLEDIKNVQLHQKALRDLRLLRAAIADKRRFVVSVRAERDKGRRDERPAEQQLRDQEALDDAQAELVELREGLAPALTFARRTAAAERRLNSRRGVLGIFRFSYYTLFEEQLRPMEVDAGATAGRHNCVFPSQETITSAVYPLASQLLITVTRGGLRRGEVRTALRAYMANAQRLAANARLVPLPDERVALQQAWIESTTPAPVVFYAPGTRAAPTGRTVGGATGASGTTGPARATSPDTGAGILVPPQGE